MIVNRVEEDLVMDNVEVTTVVDGEDHNVEAQEEEDGVDQPVDKDMEETTDPDGDNKAKEGGEAHKHNKEAGEHHNKADGVDSSKEAGEDHKEELRANKEAGEVNHNSHRRSKADGEASQLELNSGLRLKEEIEIINNNKLSFPIVVLLLITDLLALLSHPLSS